MGWRPSSSVVRYYLLKNYWANLTQIWYSTRNINLYNFSYPIVRVSYPDVRLSYPIVRVFYEVIRLSYRENRLSGFYVYRASGFAFIRFSVYRMNRNISTFSWTNKRKTQRSFTFCYYCRVIKYCWFLFAVTICRCICFLKLKFYQFYYKYNFINCLLTAFVFFYFDCTYAVAQRVRFNWKYLQMKIFVCFDVLTMSPK